MPTPAEATVAAATDQSCREHYQVWCAPVHEIPRGGVEALLSSGGGDYHQPLTQFIQAAHQVAVPFAVLMLVLAGYRIMHNEPEGYLQARDAGFGLVVVLLGTALTVLVLNAIVR